MPPNDTQRTIEAVFRIEQPRLIAGLARMLRDMSLAEEFAQDALLAALAEWPAGGIPAKPAAWLMATAKRRALDRIRHDAMRARKQEEIVREMDAAEDGGFGAVEAAIDDEIGDELLALIFTACHPILSADARAALTLRLIGGLTVPEIARAFLSAEATIAQRIVRAKKMIAAAGLDFEVPRGAEREVRLAAVLEVVYLIFNEGYAATAGDDLVRPGLCADAQRLGRILADLAPDEPEVHGLLALMEIQASRLPARTAADGSVVPLPEQNRGRWDQLLIRRGLAALARAEALDGGDGIYALQAALAACHARARRAEETDWRQIAALYDRLLARLPSPIVALNRAIAIGMAFGAEVGLVVLEALADEPILAGYAPLPAARGDMLARAGRAAEARAAFEAAAALTRNVAEQRHLLARAAACA